MIARSLIRVPLLLAPLSTLVAQQPPAFDAPVYATSNAGNSVRLVDLDADGDLDLVASIENDILHPPGAVELRLGNGAGDFGAASTIVVGSGPRDVAAGDLDGDGRVDIVSANAYVKGLSVALGSGGGAFGAAVSVASPVGLSRLELCDWNNDGDLDVLAGSSQAAQYPRLWIGNGSTALGVPLAFPGPAPVHGLQVLDINADGNLDALLSSKLDTTRFEFGDGVAGVSLEQLSPNVSEYSDTARLANFTGSALPDLVINTTYGLRYWPGVAIGAGITFGTPGDLVMSYGSVDALEVASLDSDGYADLIVASTNNVTPIAQVVLGGTSGMTAQPLLACDFSANRFALGDVDADGLNDVAGTVSFHREVWLARGIGGGAFDLPARMEFGEYTSWLATGDIDADGDTDIVGGSDTTAQLSRLLNGATPIALPPLSTWDKNSCGALGDMNGDGKLDLVSATHFPPAAVVYLGNGAGGFAGAFGNEMQAGPHDIDLADLDLDGDLDIVGTDSDQWGMWLCIQFSNGATGFTGTALAAESDFPRRSVVVDLDQNGWPDIATQRSNASCVVRYASASGVLAAPQVLALPAIPISAQGLAAADFTNDGRLDIALGARNGALALYPGLPGQTFGAAQLIDGISMSASQLDAGELLAADVNLDGRTDVVRSVPASGSVGVYFGGGAHFTATRGYSGSGSTGLALADFDLDGRLDWAAVDKVLYTSSYLTLSLQHPQSPAGIASFGSGSASWLGRATTTSAEPAVVGDPSFVLGAPNRPPRALALGVLGAVAHPAGFDPFGIGLPLHVDVLAGAWQTFAASTDAGGVTTANLAVPPNPGLAGATVHAQLFALEPTGFQVGASPLHFVSSGGVSITIQP